MAERALAEAEEMLRLAPGEQNQRRAMSAWLFVRRAREAARRSRSESADVTRSDRE
jgi:hypothetical protein